MADNTNTMITAQAWADIVINKWKDKIEKLQVHDTWELFHSFENEVMANANGDPEKIAFSFLYYGKFPDMGVGRGTPISQAGSPGTHYEPKRWYGPIFYSQVRKLADLLGEKFVRKGQLAIIENIDDAFVKGSRHKTMRG